MAETLGVEVDQDDRVTELLDSMIEQLDASVVWRPGAVELLKDLDRAGVSCAMVTMSYRRLSTVVADRLPDLFRVLVCGTVVRHGQPAPDPYMQAVELLGVAAANCVAIEGAPTGVEAAEAAGCRVLACPSMVPIPTGPKRTVVGSLTALMLAAAGVASCRVVCGSR